MQYDINPILLSSMAAIQYVSFPPLSLGLSTARLNPKLIKHFSHCKKDQPSRPNQTDNFEETCKDNQSYIKKFRGDSNIVNR